MKRLTILAFLLDLLITLPAAVAGPSTSEDWQKLYDACFQGAQTVASQQGFGPDFAAKFCGCTRDDLKSTPEDERDAQFPAIRDRCLRRATN
jgi:hypothetical protein